ncbi:FHIPEP family type III secretion protein, partial [Paenibacillus sp. MCAF20]
QQFSPQGDTLRVITVGPQLEKKIAESVQQTEQGSYIALDPVSTQQIYQKLAEHVNRQIQTGQQPVVLASPTIRMYLRQIVERTMQDVPVLSYSELEPNVEVQSIGVVNL